MCRNTCAPHWAGLLRARRLHCGGPTWQHTEDVYISYCPLSSMQILTEGQYILDSQDRQEYWGLCGTIKGKHKRLAGENNQRQALWYSLQSKPSKHFLTQGYKNIPDPPLKVTTRVITETTQSWSRGWSEWAEPPAPLSLELGESWSRRWSEWAESPTPLCVWSLGPWSGSKIKQNGRGTHLGPACISALRHHPPFTALWPGEETGEKAGQSGRASFLWVSDVYCVLKQLCPLTAGLLVAVWLLCGMPM